MTDQQRIAEIQQRLSQELQIGGFSRRSVRLIEKDIPFLLSVLAAKNAEIERLREAIKEVRERCLKQINRGEDFCYVDAWEVLDMLPTAPDHIPAATKMIGE